VWDKPQEQSAQGNSSMYYVIYMDPPGGGVGISAS